MTDADHSLSTASYALRPSGVLPEGEIRAMGAGTVELREGASRRRWSTTRDGVYAELIDGTYQLDLTKVYGQPGIPYSGGGRITLERNPAYSPVKVRGLRGNPGEYWSLQSHPQVIRHLRTSVDAVVAAGVRLEECPLPGRLKGDPEAIRRRDLIHDLCQHHLDAWSSVDPEEDDLDHFLWHLLWVPAVCGFGWWEYTAQRTVVDFALYQRGTGAWGQPTKEVSRTIPQSICQMDLPRFRAPWTVTRWLTQAEKLLGIECDFSRVSDYPSGRTGRSQVIVPRSKFLLVCHERLGSNWEGRSILRDAGEWIKLDRRATAGEGLGIETSVTGDVIVEEPEGGLQGDEPARIDAWFDNRKAQAGNGVRVPNGTKVHLLNPKDTTPDVSAQSDRYHRQIAQCLGSEHTLMAIQKAGSYAARSDASADARAAYATVFKKSVARPLRRVFAAIVRANDPEGWAKGHRWLPKIVGGGAENRDAKEALEPYVMLLQAGAVQPNPDDEAWARDAAGMPARREEAQDVPVGATLAEDSYTPPKGVQEAAQRALDVRESKPESERGMTPTGLARARDLSNGRSVTLDTLRRMVSYFARHEVDKDGSTWGSQGKGWQAWHGWGGDAGRRWAESIVARIDKQEAGA